MRPALFRPEAIEFQQHFREWGSASSLQPRSMKLASWFLVVSFACVVTFLFLAHYSRKESATGYLTPTRGTAKIFAFQRGTIREVHVSEGDLVKEGQPLLTVETDQIATNGSDVNATVLETLTSQRTLLRRNITGEEQRADSERERLTAGIHNLDTELSQLNGQIQLQTQRLRVAEQQLSVADQLRAKGVLADVEFQRRQVAMLEQKQALVALNQQLVERRSQRTETEYSLRQLPIVMAQKIQALRNDLASTEQRIAEVGGRRAYVLRAPTEGRVSTLQAKVGQSADPQRLQLEIVPSGSVLQAQLFVPAKAIGFVEPGQRVRILYDAFPYQHFGTYGGHVVNVSQTILTNTDAAGPVALREPAYRVTVALDRSEVRSNGRSFLLQPDMLLKADLILEERRLISWLLSPLTGIRM